MKVKFITILIATLAPFFLTAQYGSYVSIYQYNGANGTYHVATPSEIKTLQDRNAQSQHYSNPVDNYAPPAKQWTPPKQFQWNEIDTRVYDSSFIYNGKVGYINYGKVTIPPVYDKIEKPFVLLRVWKDGKAAIASRDGQFLTDFSESVNSGNLSSEMRVIRGGKVGYLRPDGTYSIPCRYDDILPFYATGDERLAFAGYNEKWGVISDKDEYKFNFILGRLKMVEGPSDYYYGRQAVSSINGTACVVTLGEPVTVDSSEAALTKALGHILAQESKPFYSEENKLGFKDLQGNIVIPPVYESNSHTYFDDNGCLQVRQNGKWGCTLATGRLVIPCQYDTLRKLYFEKESFTASKNGKWGCINLKGTEQIPVIYDTLSERLLGRNNFFFAGINKKYGIIDPKGNVVILLVYDKLIEIVYNLPEPYFVAQKDHKWGVLNDLGMERIPCQYDSMVFSDKNYLVEQGGKWGIFSELGEPGLPCQYDDIISHSSNENSSEWMAKVSLNGKEYYLNNKAQKVPKSKWPSYEWQFLSQLTDCPNCTRNVVRY